MFECAALFALGGVVNQLHAWLMERSAANLNLTAAISFLLLAMSWINIGWVTLPYGVQWVVFPALIWLAAALYAKGVSSGAVGLGLGSITYSSYLLHVPVQLAIIMVLDGVVGSRDVVSTPLFWVVYLMSVTTLAALAYRFVEHPLKLYCKRIFFG